MPCKTAKPRNAVHWVGNLMMMVTLPSVGLNAIKLAWWSTLCSSTNVVRISMQCVTMVKRYGKR